MNVLTEVGRQLTAVPNDLLPLNRFYSEGLEKNTCHNSSRFYSSYTQMTASQIEQFLNWGQKGKMSLSIDGVVFWEIDVAGVLFNLTLTPEGFNFMRVDAILNDGQAIEPLYLDAVRILLNDQIKLMSAYGRIEDMSPCIATLNIAYPGRIRLRGDLAAMRGSFSHIMTHDEATDFVYIDLEGTLNNPMETIDWQGQVVEEEFTGFSPIYASIKNWTSGGWTSNGFNVNYDLLKNRGRIVRTKNGTLVYEMQLFGTTVQFHLSYHRPATPGQRHTGSFDWRSSYLYTHVMSGELLGPKEEEFAVHFFMFIMGAYRVDTPTDREEIIKDIIIRESGVSGRKDIIPLMLKYPNLRLDEDSSCGDLFFVDRSGVPTLREVSFEKWLETAESNDTVSKADVLKIAKVMVENIRTLEDEY